MEKGALYLDFEHNRIVALRPSPAYAWRTARTPDAKWLTTLEPDVDVSSLMREVAMVDEHVARGGLECENAVERWRARNFRKFLEHVPSDVRALCSDAWQGRTWSYFRLLQSIPAAREVAAQPGGAHVVFALARAHALFGGELPARAKRNPLSFARTWIAHPKKEILGRLGFPAQNASVSALAKIPREHIDDLVLDNLLRAALKDEVSFKRCCHAQRLPRGLLAVLANSEVRALCSPAFLTQLEYADGFETMEVVAMISDLRAMAAQASAKVPMLQCIEHLFMVHEELVNVVRVQAKVLHLFFPSMPDVLTDDEKKWVRQLRTPAELLAEGELMHHCLGTLDHHVAGCAAGDMFAFALEGEPRMTLSIVRTNPSVFIVSDLKCVANTPAPTAGWRWARELAARF